MKFTKEFIYTKVKENDFDFFTDFIDAEDNLEEVTLILVPERGIKYNESDLILHFSLLDIYVLVKGEFDNYYDIDWVSVSLVKPKYYEKLIKEIEYEEITLEEITLEEIEQENERDKENDYPYEEGNLENKESTILNDIEETNDSITEINTLIHNPPFLFKMKFTKDFIYAKVKEYDCDFFTDFIETEANSEEVKIIQEPGIGPGYMSEDLILHFFLLDIYVLVKGEYDTYTYSDFTWIDDVSLVRPYEVLKKEIKYEEITLEENERYKENHNKNEKKGDENENKESAILNDIEKTNDSINQSINDSITEVTTLTKLLQELDFELNQADYCYWEFNEPQNLSELFNPKLDSNQKGMQKYLESLVKDNEITLRELHLINTLWEIRKKLLELKQN